MIALDTNVVIAAINVRPPMIRTRMLQVLAARTPVGIPVIALFEIRYGIAKSPRIGENLASLGVFMTLDATVWPFDPEDAEDAGDIRSALERVGKPIGPYDILIAAQARRRGAVLVTAYEREFARVPGLQCENWAATA